MTELERLKLNVHQATLKLEHWLYNKRVNGACVICGATAGFDCGENCYYRKLNEAVMNYSNAKPGKPSQL